MENDMKKIVKERMEADRNTLKGMAKLKKRVLDADEKLTKIATN